jgi:hypothetical protein
MVHHLQDETTHRLNIDVIDLSNFIFICNETSSLEPAENYRVSLPTTASHLLGKVALSTPLTHCSPRPRSCKAPLLSLLPYNVAELWSTEEISSVSTAPCKRN